MKRAHTRVLLGSMVVLLAAVGYSFFPLLTQALNVSQFSDTFSDSRPNAYANHTFSFTVDSDIAPGGYVDFAFPAEFSILATSTFGARNVEMIVNGAPRTATTTLSAANDQIVITTGEPASVRYNLNTTTGLTSGDQVEFKIGNHTSLSRVFSQTVSTTTGTSTTFADVPGVENASTTGQHRISMTTGGAVNPMYANFLVFIIPGVGVGPVNTFETIPPFRFNPAPTSTIGGTTLNVELSLETDEFARCRFATSPGTPFFSMGNQFENTGLIIHSQIIAVTNNTSYTFYVRCIDDEGNFNTDDFLITFDVPEFPTGEPNEDGDEVGDGSGSGNDGSNTNGDDSEGETSSPGAGTGSTGSTGGGGGGGGGGSGTGGGTGSEEPGGDTSGLPFESGDATVIINGFGSPGSDVVVLVDGFIAETGRANNDGKFSVTIDEIARGSYTFGIYSVDDNDVKSSTFSTTFTVSGGRSSSLSNINVVPSILVTPDPVDIGVPVVVSGFSLPDATITIENVSDASSVSLKTFTTTSDGDGAWSVEIETDRFSRGTYKVRAKAEQEEGVETDFSEYTLYGVGQEAENTINADLNRDGSVNLVDFSILLFWWGGDGGASDPPADINQDGSVSLTDFSIMLFNWTG